MADAPTVRLFCAGARGAQVCYHGVVCSATGWWGRIGLAFGPDAAQRMLWLSDALEEQLVQHSASVQSLLERATTADGFAEELGRLLARGSHVRLVGPRGSGGDAAHIGCLLAELESLGWEHVGAVSADLTQISLTARDAAGRVHTLVAGLVPGRYPSLAPTLVADLPVPFHPRWVPSISSLSTLHGAFSAALGLCQALWGALDELDATCCVLEPSAPRRSECMRRIALGTHCSLHFVLTPAAPYAWPSEMRLLGAEATLAPLRAGLDAHAGLWDASGRTSIRANLERVLGGVVLPAPQTAEADNLAHECGICYSYTLVLDGDLAETPSDVCQNVHCARSYHHSCLVDWLRSLPTTRLSFNTLFGACPYCEDQVSTRVD